MSRRPGEGTPKRARPDSPADGFRTPEKRAVAWRGTDPAGLHPRDWDSQQLCQYLRGKGFAQELLSRFTGERGGAEGLRAPLEGDQEISPLAQWGFIPGRVP